MRSGDAIAGFLDAIAHEADVEITQMDAEIMAGKLGGRALETRSKRADEIEAKIKRYASALGVDLTMADQDGAIVAGGALARIAERLNDLRASVSIAIAAVEAAKQAGGAS
jgi:uncharacterized protein (DUF3084 family)